jgi:hypothetical protein
MPENIANLAEGHLSPERVEEEHIPEEIKSDVPEANFKGVF